MALAPEAATSSWPAGERNGGLDHRPSRCRPRRRTPRRAKHLSPGLNRPVRPRFLEGLSATSATTTRWFDLACTRWTNGGVGERRRRSSICLPSDARARRGHREAPEDRHQPDARLQPLDAERHLQRRRHEDARDDRLGDQRDARSDDCRRRARGHPRNTAPTAAAHRLFASGLRNPVGLAYLPGIEHALDGGRTSATTSATISSPTSSRPSATADSTAGLIRISVSISIRPSRRSVRIWLRRRERRTCCLPSHSAALGLHLLHGFAVPAGVRNSALVALHGSINRSKLSGYRVVRVPFRDGVASGAPEDFLSGFIASDGDDKGGVGPAGRPTAAARWFGARLRRRRQSRMARELLTK